MSGPQRLGTLQTGAIRMADARSPAANPVDVTETTGITCTVTYSTRQSRQHLTPSSPATCRRSRAVGIPRSLKPPRAVKRGDAAPPQLLVDWSKVGCQCVDGGVGGVLSDISTEVLIKLLDRYLSGRTRFFVFAERGEVVECVQQKIIDAIEKELWRRNVNLGAIGARPDAARTWLDRHN